MKMDNLKLFLHGHYLKRQRTAYNIGFYTIYGIMARRIILFLFTFSVIDICYGQNSASTYKLVVRYNKKSVANRNVLESDSMNITFLYGYERDIICFKTRQHAFYSDTLNADNLYGIGGHTKIAKSSLKGLIEIYLNGQYIGSLRINKRYSLVHLEFDRESKVFTWRYHKYKFFFI
jgi:hypothetical protein